MSKGKTRSIPGFSLVGPDLAAVEKLLDNETRSEVKLVVDVGRHILGSGGKRFRPLLTLLAGRMLGMKRKKELYLYAAGIELSHTSTLLHDDVIDEADVRRGDTSANRIWGNAPSIIVGDYLLFKGFSLMISGKNLRIIELISDIAVEMSEGEAYQLAQKQRVDLTEGEYEKIIEAKTALLIRAACQIPAIAVSAPPAREKALARFGHHLGLAFQIADDVLDYSATDKKWGKQLGKDFLEGKATLPLIIAYHKASAKEKKIIKQLFKKPKRTLADLKTIVKTIHRHQALSESTDRARKHIEIAKKSLKSFPDNPARSALEEIADYVVERSI